MWAGSRLRFISCRRPAILGEPGRQGTVLAGGLILSYHDNYHDEGRRRGGPRKEWFKKEVDTLWIDVRFF